MRLGLAYLLIGVPALAQMPPMPELPIATPRTNYFVFRAQDDLGLVSDDSSEVFITNGTWKLSWGASEPWIDSTGTVHQVTNYIAAWSFRSGAQTNSRQMVNIGTNLSMLWPMSARLVTNLIIISSELRITNSPVSTSISQQFFALCATTNLSAPDWKPVAQAINTITSTNL
jgi:hypothetical protein